MKDNFINNLKFHSKISFFIFRKKYFSEKNKPVKNRLSQYKLLTIFENYNEIYILRINLENNKLELIDPAKNNVSPINLFFKEKYKIKNLENWKDTKISKFDNKFILTYKTTLNEKTKFEFWVSEDLINWFNFELKDNIDKSFLIIPDYHFNQNNIAYFEEKNGISYHQINEELNILKTGETDLRKNTEEKILPASVYSNKNEIILFYYEYNDENNFNIKLALINKDNPSQLLWKTDTPIWQSDFSDRKCYPLGIVKKNGWYKFYYKNDQENLHIVNLPSIPYPSKFSKLKNFQKIKVKKTNFFNLERSNQNPILSPIKKNEWESEGSFNPAAIFLDNKIHLVYRAIGGNGMSVFGYASSQNGYEINERLSKPVYLPSQNFEFTKEKKPTYKYPYMSGGGWGGCEDPRLSIIENNIFMTYTAFNGQQAPGVALTSIKTKDFLNKKWKWKKPCLISEPHKIQKNWVIFPEKINGKYAILHSISPQISINYFSSLDQKDFVIESHYSPRKKSLKWENYLRGVGAPPIKTDKGWLVLYHAMDSKDPNQYKLGIMLLDYKNPQKILGCCNKPILEPKKDYENNGKPGVIYVCGAIVKNEKLFVYYGGADKVSCVATASLKKIFDSLTDTSKKIKINNK